MAWLAVQSEDASVSMQPVPVVEPHLEGRAHTCRATMCLLDLLPMGSPPPARGRLQLLDSLCKQKSLCLHARADSASGCVQPVPVLEPHLDGEGAHLQGSDVPATAADGAPPAPTHRQVELLNSLRDRVFLHEGIPG